MALFENDQVQSRDWSNPYREAMAREESRSSFLNGVYQHMGLGLAVTGLVAMMTSQSPAAIELVAEHPLLLVLAQFGVVIALTGLIDRLSTPVATGLFYGYAALTGLMLSILFLIYTRQSIASTFFITGGTFGAMSLYGYTTKRDLTSFGSFLIMGLWGLILASAVNLFFQSSMVLWVTSCVGVLIFVGLTAYDTQRIKALAYRIDGEGGNGRLAILGALTLYLDFINLFLYLLRFLGNRRR